MWWSDTNSDSDSWDWTYEDDQEKVYGPIEVLAHVTSTPEAALRLLFSLLFVYPLAIFYRLTIYHMWPWLNHLFIASSGLWLIYFNYGADVLHSVLAVAVTYVLMHVLKNKPTILVNVNFAFHMLYLLTAYWLTETNDYDIIWTMPHCVLVLRLIGIVFNLADGVKPTTSGALSKEQMKAAITRVPSILELSAFAYFPASCLVGPQFSFRRYESFIAKEFANYGFTRAGLKCLGLGLMYLLIRQIGALLIPDGVFFEKQFENWELWRQYAYIAVWGKIALYKYVSCWLLAEGACTCFGISFDSDESEFGFNWSACSNIKLGIFERASCLEHYVQSFNVNTNHWVAEYVYKRLKFLNNRTISYASALLFLALWHGFHSGYYIAFFLEYMIITFEKQVSYVYAHMLFRYESFFKAGIVVFIIMLLRYIYTLVLMGLCLVPFVFLSVDKWWRIYELYNFVPFLFLGTWFNGYYLYKKLFSSRRLNNIAGGDQMKKRNAKGQSKEADPEEPKKEN